jgi:hypothetical protein
MVALMLLWSWSALTWDGHSTGSSLAGLFLGGISCVFCRAREHGGCMLVFICQRIINTKHEYSIQNQ